MGFDVNLSGQKHQHGSGCKGRGDKAEKRGAADKERQSTKWKDVDRATAGWTIDSIRNGRREGEGGEKKKKRNVWKASKDDRCHVELTGEVQLKIKPWYQTLALVFTSMFSCCIHTAHVTYWIIQHYLTLFLSYTIVVEVNGF